MLSSRAGRDESGLLLLEGTHLLQELLLIGAQPTELIATEAWLDRHTELIQAVDPSVVWRRVTEEVLGAALTTVTPDGVACLCPLTLLPEPPETCDFWLVLDRIQDPGNLGSLLRTALAADVQSVWMGSGVDPLGGKP
jgi:TrmH family RNA methyltransferase